jgi:putative endopeptidase
MEQSDFDDNSDILNMTNLATLNKLLPIDTGLLYCKYYYDDEDSDEVIKMFIDITGEYIKEFEECEWMMPATKEAAIKKIENMIGVVGYPDNYDYPTIVPMSEGGTYFINYINIMKDNKATIIHECSEKEFVRTEMFMTPSTVNACYIPTLNSMNIPAGIITWPMYDKNASYAANLGSIGAVIAHEIGHAFDANGAQYDENGCMNNWWSEEDQKLFKEKQEEFIEYYKNFEVVDGVVQDSSNTITENMADMAGIECVMSILSDDKEGQKEALLSFARMWAELGTETSLTNEDSLDDVHSSNQVRVNACVASQDCFYELFDIAEDDPMYVAPEDRLKLWIN